MLSASNIEHLQSSNQHWEQQAEAKEYMSAVNPPMPSIEVLAYSSELHKKGESRVIPIDLSKNLEINYPATTPNLIANFIKISNGDAVTTEVQATSQLFYVIRGKGRTQFENGSIEWSEGDLFTISADQQCLHTSEADSALYWVSDAPLLNYLGVAPNQKRFEPVLYSKEFLTQELEKTRAQGTGRNRTGILLSNPNFPKTMTITQTLWALYNVLPAGIVQKAHRHNSVALDYCVSAGPNTYTLIAKDIDENGNLINPVKAMWEPGAMFITPPGWWHSHHNDSNEDAIVLPIQDAGLIMNMQVLDFDFIR